MADINDALYLYLSGSISESDSQSLFIQGHSEVNSFISLYMQGMVPVDEDMPLYIDGIGVYSRSGLLFTKGHVNPVNTYAPLFVQTGVVAGSFGAQSSMSLYMGPPAYKQGMPLFLMNAQASAPFSGMRTLFIEGRGRRLSAQLSLVVFNEQISESLPLYIRAPGFWSGWVPHGQGAPLYLRQDGVDIHGDLFIGGKDELNTFISLYAVSTVDSAESLYMAIPNVLAHSNTFVDCYIHGISPDNNALLLYTSAFSEISNTLTLVINPNMGLVNTYAHLYVQGVYLDDEHLDLYIRGYSDITESIPLYIQQNNTALNTYTTLYAFGAYLESASCDLVIPHTIGYDNSVIPFYVFGW